MIHYGSSNAEYFEVHKGAGSLRSGQKRTDNIGKVEPYQDRNNPKNIYRSARAGSVWVWEYQNSDPLFPLIHVIRDRDTGQVIQAYESETKMDSPLLLGYEAQRGDLGNFCIAESLLAYENKFDRIGQYYFLVPSDDSLYDSILDRVEALPLRTWISSDQKFNWAKSNLEAFPYVFEWCSRNQGLKAKPTYQEVARTIHDPDVGALYNLIWLRVASGILYDHEPYTAVPLIQNMAFTYDDGWEFALTDL